MDIEVIEGNALWKAADIDNSTELRMVFDPRDISAALFVRFLRRANSAL
jgi:hypothetical protein